MAGLSAAAAAALKEIGTAAAASTLASGANAAINSRWAKRSYKFTKKLMLQQQAYNKEAFAMENARQDALIRNQYAMNKEALRAAGMSESMAGTDATGISAPGTSNMDVPSGSQFTLPENKFDILQGTSAALQASQAELNRVNADVIARKAGVEIDKMRADIKVALDTLPATLENIKADTAQKLANKEVSEKQAAFIDKDMDRLAEVIRGLSIDNNWKGKNYQQDYNKKAQEIIGLMKDNRIKEAEAKLADMGIVLGADGLTTLIGICATGNGAGIMEQLTEGFGQMIAKLPEVVTNILRAVWDAGSDSLKENINDAWHWLKKKVGDQ